MAEKDLPSCSDDSDADYVPEGENEALSEEAESDNDISHDGDSDHEKREKEGGPKKKRRKLIKKKKKEEEKKEEEKEEEPAQETKKIDVDAIWADFKEDVNKSDANKVKRLATISTTSTEPESKTEKMTESSSRKSNPAPGSIKPKGLSSILSHIGKKDKLSTLEKSKLDWNNFKKNEGIEEEIKTHNKGKEGYLEKQDFLQRSDLRQFEIEKQLRATKKGY